MLQTIPPVTTIGVVLCLHDFRMDEHDKIEEDLQREEYTSQNTEDLTSKITCQSANADDDDWE